MTHREAMLDILEELLLLSKVLDNVVVDFVVEKKLFPRAKKVTEFPHNPHCAINAKMFVLGGWKSNKIPYVTESYNISGIGIMLEPQIKQNEELMGLGVYPGMHVSVGKNGEVILKETSGGSVSTLPRRFVDTSNIVVAQSASKNGLAWIHNDSDLLLINVAHTVNIGTLEVLWHEPDSKTGILSASLDGAGKVLALVDREGMVNVYQVQLEDGRIRVDKCLTLEGCRAGNVMLLENNILAVKAPAPDYKHSFYRLDVREKAAKFMSVELNAKDFLELSYHAADNLVVGIVRRTRKKPYKFSELLPFIEDTKILVLNPWGIDTGVILDTTRFTMSQSTNYLLKHGGMRSGFIWNSINIRRGNIPRSTFVYHISTDAE